MTREMSGVARGGTLRDTGATAVAGGKGSWGAE
jgi:hypothetical protein